MRIRRCFKCGILIIYFICFCLGLSAQKVKGDSLYVDIVTFSVKYVPAGKSINLHWITKDSEKDVQYIIERSLDSNTYRMIGYAESSKNNEGQKDYYFYDSQPVGGVAYYRIREIVDSGRQFVTPARKVKTPISQMTLAQLVLAKEDKELDFAIVSPDAHNTNILISDIQGNIKSTYSLQLKRGANTRSIYIGNLEPGVYFLQVNNLDNSQSVMKKFIIEKEDTEK